MKLEKVKLSLLLAALLATACSSGTNGSPGADGKEGSPGAAGNAPSNPNESSLSLVTPSKGLLDREIDVSIGGSGTTFMEGMKPDFGAGIEVLEVTTSTTALITAKIRIAKDALLGPRTVTIGDIKAEKAFSVLPAINVTTDDGKTNAVVTQGGLVRFGIDNNDTRAFDASAFQLEAGDLIDIGSQASGPQSAKAFLLAPPLAKTGKSQITASNIGADGKPSLSFLSAADALGIMPRPPTAFTLDATTDETFTSSTETKLFKLTSPAIEASIVDYRIEVLAESTVIPATFVFGTGGGKNDRIGQAAPASNPLTGQYNPPPYDLHVALPIAGGASATDHYVVIADLSGKAGATAKVTASRSAATIANETSIVHAPNAPQLVGAITADSGQVLNAELKMDGEVDAYKFTVDAASKLQLAAVSDADLEIVLTKDPNVLEDPQGTAPASKKVLGYLYPGKQFAAQRILKDAVGVTDVYAVVRFDAEQGTVKTGKYTLGMRKLP